MKIVLTTVGSRGDIQPYIALGKALQEFGHEIILATHPWARNIIESYNLHHVPVGPEIDINFAARKMIENSTNSFKGLKFAIHFVFELLRDCHRGFMEVIKNSDLVIGHGLVGQTEADMTHKPFVHIAIEPMGLEKVYWKTKNYPKELSIFLFNKLLGQVFGRVYMKFRKDVGAPPLSLNKQKPYLAIVPISQHLQKPNFRWRPKTEICGFFLADSQKDFSPDESLRNFISEGEKPIFITFGSMYHGKEKALELFQIFCDAMDMSENKAILLMPDLALEKLDVPNNIYLINNIPYSWLLKQVSLVVHHFGFGTTAEVLKAGLPSIPIPQIFDQKARASKIYKSGFAHKPLKLSKLTNKSLANAIQKVKTDTFLSEQCHKLGIQISKEDGLNIAAKLINEFLHRKSK